MSEPFAEHVPRVYRFALRLTSDVHRAEDITQETFIRAWKKRRALRKGASIDVWLLRTAHNIWRDELRRAKVRRAHDSKLALDARWEVDATHDAGDAPDRAARVLRIMQHLPPRQREVLHLVACEGLSITQTAEVLGVSPEAVKASLSLARKAVRRELDPDACASERMAREGS